MRIGEETIEKIRESLDIVEIVGEYVQLKRQGRNYVGLCPFHNEQTPSFSVSPDKKIYHCFGCKAGGDLFSFIQEIEGIDFLDAVAILGEKAGIDVPDSRGSSLKKNDNSTSLYHGMELLSKFYQYLLMDQRYGGPAQQYLQSRGFESKTAQSFQIGYAVDAWETATRFLERRGFNLDEFVKIGLLSKRELNGKIFDRFRHRVIFPIHDHRGRPVAFAGRVLDDQKPKYLNSPESHLFHKGKILYGYHLARAAIKKTSEVVLFEGYVDVIKAHQAGITNVVASMGTSLTEDQASLLTRNTESIIICYDSDHAGTEAAFRAAEMLKQYGKTIKIARMPKGMDPDDYISRYGGERFKNDVLGASLTIMAFKMQYLRIGKNLNDEGEKLLYIEKVLQEVAQLTKAVERDHYLRQLSDEFSISLDALKQQQYQYYRKQKQPNSRRERKSQFTQNKRALLPAYQMAERRLLAHMMHDAEIAELVQEQIGGAFNDVIHQALAAYLYGFYSEGHVPDIASFIQSIEDQEIKAAATEIAMMSVNMDVTSQEIDDYIKQIIQHTKWAEITAKEEEKKAAERNQDFEKASQILAEIIFMKKQLERH
ncbi:DNA primase [Pullulanibacillus camelliae]|uniref:DNA primase n=1 Tax=Pullulanibacillus camelliae TaxID=1707096 RepID=A0A8J3DWU0_9BACL|nr:DNA primase [Pullulanibacillus camelliae]GGE47063.1 DNA primase [Pullulanibacillus camelliae]